MPTRTEVESKLRRSLHSAAAATTVDADWDSFTERLEAAEGTLPTLQPADQSRPRASQPVLVLASAFAVVVVAFGLLGLVIGGDGSSTATAGGDAHPIDDSLRYVPTEMPDYAPALTSWFRDGDFIEEGFVEPQPTHVFIDWVEGNNTKANAGLVIWPVIDENLGDDQIGVERDDEGFWVQEFEAEPWLRVRGETEGGQFVVDGTGVIDRDLVMEVARSIRDGQPLPTGLNDLIDVTPREDEYLTEPIERFWHLFGQDRGNHFSVDVYADSATTEPIVQLAMFPWSCELVELDVGTGALCQPGDWTLTWAIAPDVVASMSTVGFNRADVINIANSMELMTASDPRVPPPQPMDSDK